MITYPQIVHVIPDDKWIDVAADIFEELYPNQNRFVHITNSKKRELKYVKNVSVEIYSSSILKDDDYFKKHFSSSNIFIFHSINDWRAQFIYKLNASQVSIWLGWGFDYYDLIEVDLLMPLTKAEVNKLKYKIRFDNIKYLIKNYIGKQIKLKDVLAKVTYFSPVLKEEFEIISSSFVEPKIDSKYISWRYGNLEEHFIRDNLNKRCEIKGTAILIGNSYAATNNHFDSFEHIKKIVLKDQLIIVPFSYGDSYLAKATETAAKKSFKNLILLKEYVSRDEYLEVISKCAYAYMNHVRQQGLGNIIILLYLGVKVFLNEKSILYSNLIERGYIIYPTSSFNVEYGSVLSKEFKERNRLILIQDWSKSSVLEMVRDGFKKITDNLSVE